MKKIVTLFFVSILILGSISFSQTSKNESFEKMKVLDIIDDDILAQQKITRTNLANIIFDLYGYSNDQEIYKSLDINDVNKESKNKFAIDFVIGKGIMTLENKKFRPNDNLTYAEVITALIRTLGYKDSFLKGTWPSNYFIKADELNIIKDDIKSDQLINHKQLSVILDEILDTKLVKKEIANNENYYLSDQTLLDRHKKIKVFKSIKIKEYELGDKNKRIISDQVDTNYLLKEDYNSEIIINQNCDIYIKNNHIIFIDYLKNDLNEKDLFIKNAYDEHPKKKIKVFEDDNFYKVTDESKVYVNGELVNDYAKYLNTETYGKFYFEKGELKFANLITWDLKDAIVLRKDLENKEIRYFDVAGNYATDISFKNYDNYEVIIKDKNNSYKSDLNKIKKNDYIYVSDKQVNSNRKVYVFRNYIDSRVNKIEGGYYALPLKMDVGQDNILDIAKNFAYSYNNGNKILAERNKTLAGMNALLEFNNMNAKMYKNYRNEIAYITADLNVEIDIYGILVRYSSNIDGKVQIFNKDGKRKTYEFEDLQEYDRLKEVAKEGDIIKYSLSNNNRMKSLEDNIEENIVKTNNIHTINSGDDFGEDTVIIEGKKYTVDSDTIFYDYTSQNKYSVDDMDWDSFENKEVEEEVSVIYKANEDNLKLLVIWDGLDGIKQTTKLGYVKNQYIQSDDTKIDVLPLNDENIKKYKVDDSYEDYYLYNRIFPYHIVSGNNFKPIKDPNLKFIISEVEKISNKYIYLKGNAYKKDDNFKVFLGSKISRETTIDQGDYVIAYVNGKKILLIDMLDSYKNFIRENGELIKIDLGDKYFEINVNGDVEKYYFSDQMEFIFNDGYLELNDKSKSLVQKLAESNVAHNEIVFYYNKETRKISKMYIKKNK